MRCGGKASHGATVRLHRTEKLTVLEPVERAIRCADDGVAADKAARQERLLLACCTKIRGRDVNVPTRPLELQEVDVVRAALHDRIAIRIHSQAEHWLSRAHVPQNLLLLPQIERNSEVRISARGDEERLIARESETSDRVRVKASKRSEAACSASTRSVAAIAVHAIIHAPHVNCGAIASLSRCDEVTRIRHRHARNFSPMRRTNALE
jgi:hypothetical protein